MTDTYGEKEMELRKNRRDGFLAATSREDLDLTALHKYKVCERHFHSGICTVQPAQIGYPPCT